MEENKISKMVHDYMDADMTRLVWRVAVKSIHTAGGALVSWLEAPEYQPEAFLEEPSDRPSTHRSSLAPVCSGCGG